MDIGWRVGDRTEQCWKLLKNRIDDSIRWVVNWDGSRLMPLLNACNSGSTCDAGYAFNSGGNVLSV